MILSSDWRLQNRSVACFFFLNYKTQVSHPKIAIEPLVPQAKSNFYE
jgi:hypothetical protein